MGFSIAKLSLRRQSLEKKHTDSGKEKVLGTVVSKDCDLNDIGLEHEKSHH